MNNIFKTVLVALVVSGFVVGGVKLFEAPVDVDAIALEAAEHVNVPDVIKGEDGEDGSRGWQGPVGPAGPVGLAGQDGADGGQNGKDGVDGQDGVDGKDAVFDEDAFAEKYGLTESFNSVIFSGSSDAAPTLTVDVAGTYLFDLTAFGSTNLSVWVYDIDNDYAGPVNDDFTVTLDAGEYTVFVEADGQWKIVVSEN